MLHDKLKELVESNELNFQANQVELQILGKLLLIVILIFKS